MFPPSVKRSNMARMIVFFILGLVLLISIWQRKKWRSSNSIFFRSNRQFWTIEIFLITLGLAAFTTGQSQDVPFGGLILVVAFGMGVRFRLRHYLSKRWPYFEKQLSAPYFFAFLGLLLWSGLMLGAGRERSSELAAVTAYFMLIFAVVLEFIGFSKSSREKDN